MELGRSGRTLPPRRRARAGVLGGTGYRQTGGIERSAVSPLVNLTRAESSRVREGGADMSAVGQQSDPLAPAGRRFGNFRFRDIPLRGERWSSGVRGERCL